MAARSLELHGQWVEAAEQYEAIGQQQPIPAALGQARSLLAQGEWEQVEKLLLAAQQAHAESAELPAELAAYYFRCGKYGDAARWCEAARKINDDQLTARYVGAELDRVQGRLDEATAGYHWFVDYYNQHDVSSPDELRWIGLAAGQYARWQRLPDQFSFLVNDLYPAAWEADPEYWPAHYEVGLLFLEKYNQADAQRSFQQALKINPHAAEIHVALAALQMQNFQYDAARASLARARELNPRLLELHQADADLALANFDLQGALAAVEKGAEINPVDEATLARRAAAYVALDGCPEDLTGTRLGGLLAEVDARNAHAGTFYLVLATRLEERRKFAAAERFFREAQQRMPQLPGAQAGLGMMFMRLGREAEAQRLLSEAFDADPFHVRVSNTLKVLDVLSSYATLETEHFTVRYNRKHDKVLAYSLARYLESEFPALCTKFGYRPTERSLFEVFCRDRNTDGHGWFSARMVGLPYVGTTAACAGKMVALTSPNDEQSPYHWARVARHEFVHVLNLQQTDFNVPHWFTEGLAVETEGFPRPQVWNELLATRVPRGATFNLDTINFGFIRPQTSADWHLAYCQSELWIEYLFNSFGPQAAARLLAAFGQTQDSHLALERAFNVPAAQIEAGYEKFLKDTAASLTVVDPPDPRSLAELQRAHEAAPDDGDLASRLALALIDRQDYPGAARLIEPVLAANPRHALACYSQARLHLVTGQTKAASEVLERGLAADNPHPRVLLLLASLQLKGGNLDAAAALYERGRAREPWQTRWQEGLVRCFLLAGQTEKLRTALEQLAQLDVDNLVVRKKLARLAIERQDWPETLRWARESLYVDVRDVEAHRWACDAALRLDEPETAAWELTFLGELAPDDVALHRALAAAAAQSPRADEVRAALDQIDARSADLRTGTTAIRIQWEP
ncbi:MAG: tetratricopeptide repeat protein [Pirellulales bacterium]|nr:tetratricopeptide repeat protein [Pirellulales bacterium]